MVKTLLNNINDLGTTLNFFAYYICIKKKIEKNKIYDNIICNLVIENIFCKKKYIINN